MALPEVEKEETVRSKKRLTGRMVGINLEPVEEAMLPITKRPCGR